jgi:hypothetical protein
MVGSRLARSAFSLLGYYPGAAQAVRDQNAGVRAAARCQWHEVLRHYDKSFERVLVDPSLSSMPQAFREFFFDYLELFLCGCAVALD